MFTLSLEELPKNEAYLIDYYRMEFGLKEHLIDYVNDRL